MNTKTTSATQDNSFLSNPIIDNYINDVIKQTAIFPSSTADFGKVYCFLGLIGEVAEFMIKSDVFFNAALENGVLEKLINRESIISAYKDVENSDYDYLRNYISEYGDILWYINATIDRWNITSFTFKDLLEELSLHYPRNYKERDIYYKENYNLELPEDGVVPVIISFANSLKKYYRDNKHIPELELRKVLFLTLCISPEALFNIVDFALEENKKKLFDRKERNVLQGDGDNR